MDNRQSSQLVAGSTIRLETMADQHISKVYSSKGFGSSTGPGLSRIICNPAESWAIVKAIKTMPRFSGNIRRHFLRTLKNDGAGDLWRKLGANAIGDELEVEAHLGKGTFGTVEKVLDKRSGKHFALKEVKNSQDDFSYHLQLLEMTALTGVQGCDHIVKVIAMDDRRPEAPILLELCSGTLQEAVFGSNPLQCSFPDMLRFMGEVAKGLVFCHKQGFVHGDLKAANILLSKQESPGDTAGATLCAKIADFGLSVRTGTMRGPGRSTPGNVPPEVCQDYALASGCHDVFAVGSTLASMCSKAELRRWNIFISSARMAFRTMGDGSASRHYIVPDNMRSDLPEAVEVCRDMARMTDVDPDNRPTMTEVSNLCQYWAFWPIQRRQGRQPLGK